MSYQREIRESRGNRRSDKSPAGVQSALDDKSKKPEEPAGIARSRLRRGSECLVRRHFELGQWWLVWLLRSTMYVVEALF